MPLAVESERTGPFTPARWSPRACTWGSEAVNYGTSTRYSPGQVLRMAEAFFGPAGLGLEVVAQRADSVELGGQKGRVSVRVQSSGGATEAFLATEGLDYQVRQFMVEIYEEAHRH